MRTICFCVFVPLLCAEISMGQSSAIFDHGYRMARGFALIEQLETPVRFLNGSAKVVPRLQKQNKGHFLRSMEISLGKLVSSKRTPTRYVGAVMAILGTLNEVGVLPPEADPKTNQLIRSLIQFQSVFLKSQEPTVREYFILALSERWGTQGQAILEDFGQQGWTSQSLEALVEHSLRHSMWENPHMETVFHSYNLNGADWGLIQEIFLEARQRFVSQSQDLHEVFGCQRQNMLVDGSEPC